MPQSSFKRAILFLIDGAGSDTMQSLVDAGELPQISRHLVEKSTVQSAVTCFPSTTGPAFTPPMTGCFPGTSNIPGVRWFDRTLSNKRGPTLARFRNYYDWGIYRFDSDLSKNIRTLYEVIPQSVSILGFLNRGTKFSQKKHYFKSPYIFFRATKKDDVHYVEQEALRYFKSHVTDMPRFVFYYFPIVDLYSHRFRKNSDKVKACFRRIDHDVGEIVETLKEAGCFENTLLMMTSDHGHGNIDRHFDVDAFLQKKFANVLFYPNTFRNWKKADAVNMVSGNCMTHLYIRNGSSWHQENTFENLERSGLVESLLTRSEVAFVMGRSEAGSLVVQSRKGRARLGEEDGAFYYEPLGHDPFGFEPLPRQLGSREVLSLTFGTAYPDAIVQTVQLFRSPRAGDLVLTSAEGCDLRAAHFENPEHRSGHGSLAREQMIVPFFANCSLSSQPARTADIFPTILDALGIKHSHLQMDGVSLLDH